MKHRDIIGPEKSLEGRWCRAKTQARNISIEILFTPADFEKLIRGKVLNQRPQGRETFALHLAQHILPPQDDPRVVTMRNNQDWRQRLSIALNLKRGIASSISRPESQKNDEQ